MRTTLIIKAETPRGTQVRFESFESTPLKAKAKAEQAGYVNVRVVDFENDVIVK
jgi:hypothetical protein